MQERSLCMEEQQIESRQRNWLGLSLLSGTKEQAGHHFMLFYLAQYDEIIVPDIVIKENQLNVVSTILLFQLYSN